MTDSLVKYDNPVLISTSGGKGKKGKTEKKVSCLCPAAHRPNLR